MSIDRTQLRALIRDTLTPYNLWSESAEELLILTCAVESDLGTYIKQRFGGPALGIFQMEPNTEEDNWRYLYRENKKFWKVVKDFEDVHDTEGLEYDLQYMIIMCRIHYWKVPKALPNKNDVKGLANYWKKYYNTSSGKGTIKEAVKKYEKYVEA